ncbi:hypothetical protein QJS10_CPB17g00267 [Acorus calamus]|uniref:Uncharacterized protein n=1 Tax=Acorus calamus TaxID=4465 RepID=A0AAV9CUF4_ACOCL|nr:hypothetical protein QJS10_CPB17g00267 [Acorus calamus]
MFEEQTQISLHGWAKGARKKIKDDHALLNVFVGKHKKNESSSDAQVQEMVAVSCWGANNAKQPVALEEIVTSPVCSSRLTHLTTDLQKRKYWQAVRDKHQPSMAWIKFLMDDQRGTWVFNLAR